MAYCTKLNAGFYTICQTEFAEIDQTIAENSQIVQVTLHPDAEKKPVRNEAGTQNEKLDS